jgi:hypothetical protein
LKKLISIDLDSIDKMMIIRINIDWSIICQPRDQGTLGIQNIEVQNKCLLSKCLFKLINEEGVWQKLLRNKYMRDTTIGQVLQKPEDSHFWSGLMKVKDSFLNLGKFWIGDGQNVRF